MQLKGRTWNGLVIGALVFAAVNFLCWAPGIGGRGFDANGHQPPGTEVELYFGWPAYYRAELWVSDESLTMEQRKKLPLLPDSMRLEARYVGVLPAVIDLAFAGAALFLLAWLLEAGESPQWSLRTTAAAVGLLGVLVFCVAIGWWVGVHL